MLGLVESDEEDSDIIFREPVAQSKRAEKMPAVKKSRAGASNKGADTAHNATRRGGKAAAGTGRKALAEKTSNSRPQSAAGRGKKRPLTEDVEADEASVEDDDKVDTDPKPRGRGRPRGAKAAKLSAEAEESVLQEAPESAPQPNRRGRPPKKAQAPTPPAEVEIPETQQPDVEIPGSYPIEPMDESVEEEQAEGIPVYNHAAASPVRRVPQREAPFSVSRSRNDVPGLELNDSSLRRRLGELTRKYDSLEVKYRDLREIGVIEAERNFDKLKKQGEERAKSKYWSLGLLYEAIETDLNSLAANELIASLKAQLAAQTELARESQQLRKRLAASESNETDLKSKTSEMTTSLAEAKREIKTLTTRLAASRAAEAASATRVPGSAVKNNGGNKQLLANAESAVQNAQMKENLYADLTGLIIRSVKRENDEEVYDCLQTGRNGSKSTSKSMLLEQIH